MGNTKMGDSISKTHSDGFKIHDRVKHINGFSDTYGIVGEIIFIEEYKGTTVFTIKFPECIRTITHADLLYWGKEYHDL